MKVELTPKQRFDIYNLAVILLIAKEGAPYSICYALYRAQEEFNLVPQPITEFPELMNLRPWYTKLYHFFDKEVITGTYWFPKYKLKKRVIFIGKAIAKLKM